MDILASIGGLNAFITPIVSKLVPFFVIAFLFSLAKIIKDYASKAYRDELISTLELSSTLISKKDYFDGKEALVQRINKVVAQIKDLPDETDWLDDSPEAVEKIKTYNEDLEIQQLIKDINQVLGYTVDQSEKTSYNGTIKSNNHSTNGN